MSRTFKRAVFAVSILLVALVFLGGMGPSRVRADSQQDGAYPEMEVYSEVLKKVQTDYVVDPNMTKVTVGALHGLLESLDPNSSYLTPEEYNAYKQHNNEGVAQVGLNISKRYGYATVVSVDPLGTALLARVVGEKRAREIWYLCRRYPAAEALAMGLVNRVVPDAELDAEVDLWCDEIVHKSPTAIAIAKRTFNADGEGLRGAGMLGFQALALYFGTEEAKEGGNAFREKREADFFAAASASAGA